MSILVDKKLEALKTTEEEVFKWAKENGYGQLLPGNPTLVKQIWLDAHDEPIEFPELGMRGRRVTVSNMPTDGEEWVVMRLYMAKIAKTVKYPMCPEPGCYAKVKDNKCTAKNPHGFVDEASEGFRQYYAAGDGSENKTIFVIVPAKYAMKSINFEKMWCDVKGIFNEQLGGLYADLILPISDESAPIHVTEAAQPKRKVVVPPLEEGEQEVELPKGVDVSSFAQKPKEEPKKQVSDEDTRKQSEQKQFQQIVPFFSGHLLLQFQDFVEHNKIKTPIEELIKLTPGCRIEGEGKDAKVFYDTPKK
jgi:hypothetical protein